MAKPIVSGYQLPWARGLDFSSSVAVGDLIFPSGVTGHRDDGTLPTDFEGQLRQAFANLDTVLQAQGGSLGSIVRVTIYFARRQDYADFRRLRPQLLSSPFPASTGVVVELLIEGLLVELDAIAVRGDGRTADDPQG